MELEERIKKLVGSDKEYIVGYAFLGDLLPVQYGDHCYAIVIGRKLEKCVVESLTSGPSHKYWEYYKLVNRDLSALAHNIANELKRKNISTIVIEPTLSEEEMDEEYYETLRTDFSHKMAGTRAGLGWIGKTDLFVSEKFGPRLRLVTILTDYPLICENEPIDESRCGDCRRCVEKCPAKAANGKSWDIDVDRDEFYDAFKCREKCLELSMKNINHKLSLCGICIAACPIGKTENKNKRGNKKSSPDTPDISPDDDEEECEEIFE